MRLGILTDSISDLPYAFCKDHNIRMISSYVNKGGKSTSVRDDKMNKVSFYKHIHHIEPKTHAPSQRDFLSVYSSMADGYDVIFSLHSASTLNSVYKKASKVVDEHSFNKTKIYVYDTGQLSGGLGAVVRAVSFLIESGATVEMIRKEIPKFISKAIFSCVIPSDKLIGNSENLNRNNLKLKTNSILTLNQGGVVMGKINKKMFKNVDVMQSRAFDADPMFVNVTHSVTPKENFAKKSKSPDFLWSDLPDDVHNQFLGEGVDSVLNVMNPSLISHLGMGTIGIGYIAA